MPHNYLGLCLFKRPRLFFSFYYVCQKLFFLSIQNCLKTDQPSLFLPLPQQVFHHYKYLIFYPTNQKKVRNPLTIFLF